MEDVSDEIHLGPAGVSQRDPGEVSRRVDGVAGRFEILLSGLRARGARPWVEVPLPIGPHDPDHVLPPMAAAGGRILR